MVLGGVSSVDKLHLPHLPIREFHLLRLSKYNLQTLRIMYPYLQSMRLWWELGCGDLSIPHMLLVLAILASSMFKQEGFSPFNERRTKAIV